MTIINKIKATGFKSFAKPIDFIFGNNFNAIIGPNGSGKSNVMDALVFVMGELSAKSMRAQKAANLIFNGGKKGEPSKYAEVNIHFDNSKKTFPLETKEIVLTRRVRQNGNSVYKINNEVRTRQQVMDLLSLAKIDPDGHNIVLQGDIVRFMEMHPNKRRELIEEVSGISVYEDKKKKAMTELENVQLKLNEANIILKEREAHLRELKNDRDQALNYKELQDKIKSNQATYIHSQIKERQTTTEEIKKRIEKINKDIEKINSKVSIVNNKINDKKSELEKINSDIEEKGEKEQIALQKDVEELRTNVVKIEERISGYKSELIRINSRKQQLKEDYKDNLNRIKELEENKKNLENKKKSISTDQRKLEEKITTFRKKHGLVKFGNIEEALENIDKKIDEKQSEIQEANDEKIELIREKDQLKFKLDNINLQLDKINEISKKELNNLRIKKEELNKINNNLKKNLDNDNAFSAQLGRARSNLYNNQELFSKLNARRSSVQDYLAAEGSIKAILKLKNKIKGIHGSVSELGKVNSKYSLALEVAAGSRIKSIVVDSDLTAAKCIKYLKENKLGTAVFLPINKLKPKFISEESKKLKQLTHGFAVDLIDFDKKFKSVFNYVFGYTLVVDNIEKARKIGIGRIRMVSLDGDLFESSGAMIGGFRRRTTGLGFQEKDVINELNNLGDEIKRLRSAIDNIEKQRENNLEITDKLRNKKIILDGDISKIENQLNVENINELKNNRKEIEVQLKSMDRNMKESHNKVNNIIKELEQIKKNKSDLRDKLTKGVSFTSLNNIERENNTLREELIELNTTIKGINNQVNMITPESENISTIIKQQDKDYKEFNEEINELTNTLKNNKVSLKIKEKAEREFQSNYKGLFDSRNKLSENIQKLEISIIKENEKIKGSEHKVNSLNLDKAKYIAEVEGLTEEFKEFENISLRRGINIDDLRAEIKEFEKTVNSLGNINMRALEIYEEVQKEYTNLVEKSGKLKSEKEDVLSMMYEIDKNKKQLFMKTFNEIQKNFTEIFSKLSTKGEAKLVVENEEDPFTDGIDIRVRIIGNRFLDIKSLSGGEKTLVALSFIFAIQDYDPAPFYFLDEVDASLDKHNSGKLSNLIKQYSSKAQYIVITHNDSVISEADQIYGVSMQSNGISKVVSLKV